MPITMPLSIFTFESTIVDILNQEKERMVAEHKSTIDTCKDVLHMVSSCLHEGLAKDQLPGLLSAISHGGKDASDNEKEAEIWKGPINNRELSDPYNLAFFDPKTKSWNTSIGITYDDFDIIVFKYATKRAWADEVGGSNTMDIAVMIMPKKKEVIASYDVAQFFDKRAYIITSTDRCINLRKNEMNAWVMINGLIDTAVECHWDPEVVEHAAAPLIRMMMNHDVFDTCTIKAYASKPKDSKEPYTDLDIVVNPDPKIAKKIYKRCFRMVFRGFRPIDNHVRRLAFDMSEYFGKLFALKTRPEVLKILAWSIKDMTRELEAKLDTELIKSEIFDGYSGIASVAIKSAKCPSGVNPHCADISVAVKYWNTFSYKADFPLEIEYNFKVYFDESLKQTLSSDGSAQTSLHTEITTDWHYFVGPAYRVLPGAVIDPNEDQNPENDSDAAKSLKKIREKRVEEAHSQEPYDNDIAFLKYMRKCINSDCATPWNSDKISEALKVIFCRETEKKSIADILTEIMGHNSFGETVTDIETSTKRKLTTDDFDVIAFKYTPTRIHLRGECFSRICPVEHDSDIVSMVMLSKETLASTDIGDAGYGHAIIHTSYFADDKFYCNGDEIRCIGTKRERRAGAKMRVWAAINGLIDTAIARQWDPGDVVHYSAPLIRRLLGDGVFKAATILANDSKPAGASDSDPYTNLSLIVTIDPEVSKNAYGDAIRFVFNGFRNIDKETRNISEVLRLILSTVFNMNKVPSEEDMHNSVSITSLASLHDVITTALADFNYYPTVTIDRAYPVYEQSDKGVNRYIAVKILVEYMGTLSCKTDEALKMEFDCAIFPDTHIEGKDDQCMITITSDWHYDTDACTLMMLPGAEIDHSASVNLTNSESTDLPKYAATLNPDKYHESSSDKSDNSTKNYFSKELEENMRYLANEYINELLNRRRNKEDNYMNEENVKPTTEAEKPVEEATTNPAGDSDGGTQKNEDNPYPFETSSGICYNYILDAKAKCCGNTQHKLPMLFKFPNMDDVCVCFTSMKINNDAHERDYSESYMDVSTHIIVNNFRSIGLFTTNNTKLSIYDATGNNSAELMRSYMNNIMWRLNISAHISFLKITPAPLNENAAILHFRFGSRDNFGFEKHVNDYGNLYQRIQNAIILMVKSLVLADHATIMTMSRVHSMNMNGVYSLIYSNATGHEFKNEYYDLFECNFHDALMDICDDMLK